MDIGATILGCASTGLSTAERSFFQQAKPFGFILFARNIETPEQVRSLIADLRGCVGRADAPVLIDQEGGRVARLRPPHWYDAPPAAVFADLFQEDPSAGEEALRLNTRLIAADLIALGIDVDCTPVLDVPIEGADDIIGDRAYGSDPDQIAHLGEIVGRTMLESGVIPIIKHIPGHGRALCDSHFDLPHVDASADQLRRTDFAPFQRLSALPWAMTAHVVFTAIDASAPATLSPTMINNVIREQIGFDGLLLSDDMSMKALDGPLDQRARQARQAGCDIALHCNGDMKEMIQVSDGAGVMDDAGMRRVASGRAMMGSLQDFDRDAALHRLAQLLERRSASSAGDNS